MNQTRGGGSLSTPPNKHTWGKFAHRAETPRLGSSTSGNPRASTPNHGNTTPVSNNRMIVISVERSEVKLSSSITWHKSPNLRLALMSPLELRGRTLPFSTRRQYPYELPAQTSANPRRAHPCTCIISLVGMAKPRRERQGIPPYTRRSELKNNGRGWVKSCIIPGKARKPALRLLAAVHHASGNPAQKTLRR